MIYQNKANIMDEIYSTKTGSRHPERTLRLFLLDFERDVEVLSDGKVCGRGRCVLMSNYLRYAGKLEDFGNENETTDDDFLFNIRNVFVEPRTNAVMIVPRIDIDITYLKTWRTVHGSYERQDRVFLFPSAEQLIIKLNLNGYNPQYVKVFSDDNVRLNYFG